MVSVLIRVLVVVPMLLHGTLGCCWHHAHFAAAQEWESRRHSPSVAKSGRLAVHHGCRCLQRRNPLPVVSERGGLGAKCVTAASQDAATASWMNLPSFDLASRAASPCLPESPEPAPCQEDSCELNVAAAWGPAGTESYWPIPLLDGRVILHDNRRCPIFAHRPAANRRLESSPARARACLQVWLI